MLQTIAPAQMRAVEQAAFDRGVPSLLLMEQAACEIVRALEKFPAGRVLFAAGSGNNGGDALAAARIYAQRGGRATVWLPLGCKTPDARINLRYLRLLEGVEIIEGLLPEGRVFDAVADGLLGTGLSGVPAGAAAEAIARVNALRAPVLAIDVPSGLDALTGEAEICVRAACTVTFHRPKPGLYLTPRRECVGEVQIASIGVPPCADDANGFWVAEEKDLARLLPPRALNAHKGDCGRALLYCGSSGMAGAAVMAAQAALRGGAGLVTLCCPAEIVPILQAAVPSAMCAAAARAPARNVQLFGCGIAENEQAWAEILRLHDAALPSVWDAGALNLLARFPMRLGENAVITPHVGEAARLLAVSPAQIMRDLPAAAEALRQKYGCAVALKSFVTVLTDAGGAKRALHIVGTPALAKGGSGDVLAGLMTALRAQGLPAFEAMQCACLWHGMAARRAAAKHGVRGTLPQDVLDCLGEAENGR